MPSSGPARAPWGLGPDRYKLSPATPLVPVAWLNDIQPRVEATRLPETTGIYRFSIDLDLPPECRDRVQEVQYVFDYNPPSAPAS